MADPDSYDAAQQARHLYRENLWLRKLLTVVAEDLEAIAAHRPGEARVLLKRATRVRRRLWEGVPEGWSSER